MQESQDEASSSSQLSTRIGNLNASQQLDELLKVRQQLMILWSPWPDPPALPYAPRTCEPVVYLNSVRQSGIGQPVFKHSAALLLGMMHHPVTPSHPISLVSSLFRSLRVAPNVLPSLQFYRLRTAWSCCPAPHAFSTPPTRSLPTNLRVAPNVPAVFTILQPAYCLVMLPCPLPPS
jgi:hypothetical protein